MFGSRFGVLNHRTHRSRIRSTSLRSMPSSSLMYTKLLPCVPSTSSPFDACRDRPDHLLELVLEVRGQRPRGSSARQPSEPSKASCQQSSRPFEGFCCFARRHLLASFLYCHGAFISVSMPRPAHQTCATRARLQRGVSSTAVESMMSVMLMAMSDAGVIVDC